MLNIDHNPKTRTWRELVKELTDALIDNPDLADQPAAFTTEADHEGRSIYYVRTLEEDEGGMCMGRGL